MYWIILGILAVLVILMGLLLAQDWETRSHLLKTFFAPANLIAPTVIALLWVAISLIVQWRDASRRRKDQ